MFANNFGSNIDYLFSYDGIVWSWPVVTVAVLDPDNYVIGGGFPHPDDLHRIYFGHTENGCYDGVVHHFQNVFTTTW
ncbi:MAG TPA: hypothetical protein VNM22_12210 [Candidatus Limnocylindrales bacterium]|nr:hypothetical protein [Candidatus Limnocylindrales bacterium]